MRFLSLLAVLLLMAALPVPAQTTEATCATNAAGGTVNEARYFCEPMDAVGFIQFAQLEEGLRVLEAEQPDLIEVKVMGRSVEGRPLYFVEVTNEASPVAREDKLQIGYSASIHANEAAGREGMARMVEDLVRGIGPHGAELRPLLDRLIVNVWFPNPDSWATGDYFDADGIAAVHECQRGPVPLVGGPSVGHCSGFDRENALGVDLNREFPNPGLIHTDHTPMSEPESQAVVKELRFSGNHSSLVAAMDLHGMINSANMIRSIIPNQDYDLRRMVLAVDMLRTMQERIEADPAFEEWSSVDQVVNEALGLCPPDPTGLAGCDDAAAAHDRPMQWGARWDMIGYTDTGFTSDYLMLSPRSPTGGMGAVGTITEFAYSHVIPDNKYVAKLTDMHVAGVRQMVRTQMELALRMDSPVLVGTGPVGYLDDGSYVSSDDDPLTYMVGRSFDRDDPETWFDFDQVAYNVTNLRFWRDLDRFSEDPITPIPTATFGRADLAGLEHLVLTDQVVDALTEQQLADIDAWVEAGGHLLVTDASLRYLERHGHTARQIETYLGYTDLQDRAHPLVAGVDWGARVTGEGPAIGMQVGTHYPQWVLTGDAGLEVVGTTQGMPSLGRMAVGSGSVDFLGAALPMPVQDHAPCGRCEDRDHRYGLADYSVSALTYWIVMNSLGGELEWQPLDAPFVPHYDFDPLNGPQGANAPDDGDNGTPGTGLVALVAGLAGVAVLLRRRR